MTELDVAIIGGGLAGLALARQLRLKRPTIRVQVLEKSAEDPATAAHKVGESTVEGGSHYLRSVLQLADYLDETHLPKLGLRFFGGSRRSFSERFEIGAIDFPPVPSMQMDRGVLERDLQAMVREQGVTLTKGCDVRQIVVNEGKIPHHITAHSADGLLELDARWVIDASGRRRVLARRLGLPRPAEHAVNSSWWRLGGRLDADALPSKCEDWSIRTRRARWFSTNHITGDGYWIWLIPLCSGNTSVGIVADERLHPIRARSTYSDARSWLEVHEPELARFLGAAAPLDFHALKQLAHTSSCAFSTDRWACVGEAFAFTDPLYSLGTDLIGWANGLATTIIDADLNGELSAELVDSSNALLVDLVDDSLSWFRDNYRVFASDGVLLYKLLWDALVYFSFYARGLLHGVPGNPAALTRYTDHHRRVRALTARIQPIFRHWAPRSSTQTLPPGLYHPFVRCPSIRGATLSGRELQPQSYEAFFAEQAERLALLQDLALALLWVAAEDLQPEAVWRLRQASRLDPEAIGLDPATWEADGFLDAGRPVERVRMIVDELHGLHRAVDPRTEFPSTTDELRRGRSRQGDPPT